MNADGTPGVDVSIDVGAELPILTSVSIVLLLTGGVLLVAGALMIGLAGRRRRDS